METIYSIPQTVFFWMFKVLSIELISIMFSITCWILIMPIAFQSTLTRTISQIIIALVACLLVCALVGNNGNKKITVLSGWETKKTGSPNKLWMLFCVFSCLPLITICHSSFNVPFFGVPYLVYAFYAKGWIQFFQCLGMLDHCFITFIRLLRLWMSHKLIVSKMVTVFDI